LNEDGSQIDPAILRPMARLGGITYSRVVDGMELLRPEYDQMMTSEDAQKLAKPKAEGQ